VNVAAEEKLVRAAVEVLRKHPLVKRGRNIWISLRLEYRKKVINLVSWDRIFFSTQEYLCKNTFIT
jgi:hypothetical protein